MKPVRPIRDARLGLVLRGTYRLEQLLGRGGTGAVYRATDLRDGSQVAVKVLRAVNLGLALADTVPPDRPPESGDPRSARRFAREARIIANLHHPHIVKVFAFDQEDHAEEAYLAMELLAGVTLGRVLKGRRLTPVEALALYGPLCDAMDYAHHQGIVHRDLKPDNIFLVSERLDDPRVLDFGISKQLSPDASQLTDDSILGTPAYMAPELIRAPSLVDARADVFALGAMLYHALTGHVPFEGESLLAVLNKVLSEEAPPPRRHAPWLSPAVDRVVVRALCRDPAARYQSAKDLHGALLAAVSEVTQRFDRAEVLAAFSNEAEAVLAGVAQTMLMPVVADETSATTPVTTDPPAAESAATPITRATPSAPSVLTPVSASVLPALHSLPSAPYPLPAPSAPYALPASSAPYVLPVVSPPDLPAGFDPSQHTGSVVPDLRPGLRWGVRGPSLLPRNWPYAALIGAAIGLLIGLIGLLADR